MFAIAISITDSRGNDKVKAFMSNARTETEALGEAFIQLSKLGEAFIVLGWDIAPDEESLLNAIEMHVRAGQKIPAIKALREIKKYGLREAKEFVDAHWYDWPKDSAEQY
jgi:ribosomal protein L7/L12